MVSRVVVMSMTASAGAPSPPRLADDSGVSPTGSRVSWRQKAEARATYQRRAPSGAAWRKASSVKRWMAMWSGCR